MRLIGIQIALSTIPIIAQTRARFIDMMKE